MSTKIGIITFHKALNYGAILQTYALQTVLEKLGYNPVVLDYDNPYVSTSFSQPRRRNYRNPLNYRKDVKKYKLDKAKQSKLSGFSAQYIHLSQPLNSNNVALFAKELDAVITGSDQVWNDKITHNDDTFYLSFAAPSKRISYAASIGGEEIPQTRVRRIYRFLREFKAISVRETQAQNAISSQLGLDVQRVLDPTLLLSEKDYSQIMAEPEGEKYILLYMLFYSERLVQKAMEMATKLGCSVYCVNASATPVKRATNRSDAGIEEWLGLLKNAEYVFTNSFHGVAFSINFRKQFAAELPPARIKAGSRIIDLLKVLGLSNRIMTDDRFGEEIIDYVEVSKKLQMEKERSVLFLKTAIGGKPSLTGRQVGRSILSLESDRCSGCGYCSLVCAVEAITMKQDENGFVQPVVEPAKCINCGKCARECPMLSERRQIVKQQVYAAINRNAHVLKHSSSGGVFYALAEQILSQNGAVYGAAFNEKFELAHRRITSVSQIKPLMGSKYLQSNAYRVFPDVLRDLSEGRAVLFVGTPCQVAALRKFCRGKGERLYLVDFVCHGVPSPVLIRDHIRYVENYFHSKVIAYVPRSKVSIYGHSELFEFGSRKSEWEHPITQAYKHIFYSSSSSIRPSCGKCPFTNFARPGDLTIADFWGIERSHPEIQNANGVSLVLVNTDIGQQLFSRVDTLKLTKVSQDDIPRDKQPHLFTPIKIDIDKAACFWNDYHHYGWKYIAEKYALCSRKELLKWKLKQTKTYQVLRGKR